MVYKSSNVCVGCSPFPSPAFIMGTSLTSDASKASPAFFERSTITSA